MRPTDQRRRLEITARDRTKFSDYFESTSNPRARLQTPGTQTQAVCTEKLRYIGQSDLKRDLDNFKAATAGAKIAEAYLPANTPGTIEHWMANEHYKNEEEFVFAIADAVHEEYQAIVDAGFQLQIDDPDLPDGWNCLPGMSVQDYRKYAMLRVDALNHALKGIPKEKVRLHVCWGSFHGPHYDDIPLKDIADIIFKVNAGSFSIEASNPCHEHEWNVFEEVKLPKDATLVPGVIGHYTDFIEHPDLIAQRLVRYAKLVGPRERARRHGLRHRHARRPSLDLLGEVRGDGGRRAARDETVVGTRLNIRDQSQLPESRIAPSIISTFSDSGHTLPNCASSASFVRRRPE